MATSRPSHQERPRVNHRWLLDRYVLISLDISFDSLPAANSELEVCSIGSGFLYMRSIKMDSFSRGDTLIVDTSCGFYVYGLGCEKSHVEKEECACWKIEDTANIACHGISSVPLVSEADGLMVQDTAGAPAMICPVGDIQGHFSSSNATSDEEVIELKQTEAYKELCHPAPFDLKRQKALARPETALQDKCSFPSNYPTYERSSSLPATSNPISAMKGSRAQNGSPPNVKLHVRWAPEVYDPPCTLMSHTVKKSYYHRHKAKKKDRNKHKHKGKSTRGSSSERRIPNRSSVTNMAEPVDTRLQITEDGSQLNGHEKSSTEALEYAVSKQDSMCRSTVLREALAKVHISMAEAT
ncbi:hypothetical protein OPV22_004654 [Ensete ventricosum]|uniref:Uncharacterized protein n=1 Tax=Ensete ventricosum TaxID=4639 RepID=A0AAV8RL18_ENSVE|nr:hypothetical protein OPV22_004654 [Ensete ventricosum]